MGVAIEVQAKPGEDELARKQARTKLSLKGLCSSAINLVLDRNVQSLAALVLLGQHVPEVVSNQQPHGKHFLAANTQRGAAAQIHQPADFTLGCGELASQEFVAVDTEFMRENSYWPELCLIQIADDNEAAAIDPMDGVVVHEAAG